MENKILYIFTDGSFSPKTKDGGWGFSVSETTNTHRPMKADYGYSPNSTNNRMELTAVMNGLYFINSLQKLPKKIIIYTDSKYVSDAFYLGWVNSWVENNWIKSDGRKTKNKDIWEVLISQLARFKRRGVEVTFSWVKGHNGNFLNEYADRLANKGRTEKYINKLYGLEVV